MYLLPTRLLPCLFLLAVPALCPAATSANEVAPATAAADPVLVVARAADEVLLTWTMPEGEFRKVEIMRNATGTLSNRGRVGQVRGTSFTDKVPDAATYWYWVKLTKTDDSVINIGPVATPPAEVWSPNP